ncbi:MAG: DUF6703 family protein, partial [Candidatus Nanopelagicales bacterium]
LGPRPQRVPAATKSPARIKFERISLRPLTVIHRLPRLIVPIVMGALLLTGLLLPSSWAGLLLVALAAILGWFVALSWPAIVPSARALRVVVIIVIAAAAVWRLTGHQ